MSKGVKFGRKRTIDREQVRALDNEGIGVTEIARRMKMGRSTVYKILDKAIEVSGPTGCQQL
jgi:DNA invertase Pin-like site-specific DNA recombinase